MNFIYVVALLWSLKSIKSLPKLYYSLIVLTTIVHRKIHRNTVKNIYLNVFDYSVALIRNNEIAVQHQIKLSPGYTNQLRRIGCTLQLDEVMFRQIISMVYCNKCK